MLCTEIHVQMSRSLLPNMFRGDNTETMCGIRLKMFVLPCFLTPRAFDLFLFGYHYTSSFAFFVFVLFWQLLLPPSQATHTCLIKVVSDAELGKTSGRLPFSERSRHVPKSTNPAIVRQMQSQAIKRGEKARSLSNFEYKTHSVGCELNHL